VVCRGSEKLFAMYPDILNELALAWIPLPGDIVGIIVSYEIPPRHIELQSWFSSQPPRVRNLVWIEFHCSFARDVRGFETSNLALKKKVAEFCEREIKGLTLDIPRVLSYAGVDGYYVDKNKILDWQYEKVSSNVTCLSVEHVLFILNGALSGEDYFSSTAWLIWHTMARGKCPYWYLTPEAVAFVSE
jgi:hypothetical protein